MRKDIPFYSYPARPGKPMVSLDQVAKASHAIWISKKSPWQFQYFEIIGFSTKENLIDIRLIDAWDDAQAGIGLTYSVIGNHFFKGEVFDINGFTYNSIWNQLNEI